MKAGDLVTPRGAGRAVGYILERHPLFHDSWWVCWLGTPLNAPIRLIYEDALELVKT